MNATMEELKFIGFIGIFSQSFKTIFTSRKLFTQIITLILPLAFIFIAHMTISHRFFNQFDDNRYQLFAGAFDNNQSYHATVTDLRYYLLFKSITIATVTVFSVLSTAAVVYTIASVYTGRDVTFRQSMKSVPKVWIRVTVTLICMFISLFAYTLIAYVLIFLFTAVIGFPDTNNLVSMACNIVYIFGFIYLITVWQVATVVSVLESSSGVKAMIKSTDLLAGKRKTAFVTTIILYQCLQGVMMVFMDSVIYDDSPLTPVWRVVTGILCGLLVVIVFLLFIVTETMVYLVCKSYHRETIDPVSLSTYLGAYLSDSRPVIRLGVMGVKRGVEALAGRGTPRHRGRRRAWWGGRRCGNGRGGLKEPLMVGPFPRRQSHRHLSLFEYTAKNTSNICKSISTLFIRHEIDREQEKLEDIWCVESLGNRENRSA